MPYKMNPERLQLIETLIAQYHPSFELLSQTEACALGHARDILRVQLCAWHMKDFQAHELWVMEQLGHVCHLEGKKIRLLLAQKHREWIDLCYPWLQDQQAEVTVERRPPASRRRGVMGAH